MDMDEVKTILARAEETKKEADLLFGRGKLDEAIEAYTSVLKELQPLRGSPHGENCSIRCLANQAQCYIKQGQWEPAVAVSDFALSIASVVNEHHLVTKIFKRRAIAYEQLGKLPLALASVDWAIRFGDDTEDSQMCRDRIVAAISAAEDTLVAIPPNPKCVAPMTISQAIKVIIESKCDPALVIPVLAAIIDERGALDFHDSQNNNILWAVCQACIQRALHPTMDADGVLPVLELLLQNGCRANQRFAERGQNKTPLQMFAVAGAVSCVDLMLRSGAVAQLTDTTGWSALEVACAADHPRNKSKGQSNHEVVSLLLEAKAVPVYRIPGSGMCALALACQAGDGESVLCLLKAGAVINMRCAIGFSPLVWAMIGNGGKSFKENRAINVIYRAVSSINVPGLLDEANEDMKCFHIAALLQELRMVLKAQLASVPEADVPRRTHEVLVGVLRSRFGQSTAPASPAEELEGAPAAAPKKARSAVEEANAFFTICAKLIPNFIPRIMTKRWLPKPEETAGLNAATAMSNAAPIERCWLASVMCSVTGPKKQSDLLCFGSSLSPSVLESREYGIIACYPEFMKLVRAPLAAEFSPFIPSPAALDLMAESRYLVTLDDSNEYWGRLLRQYNFSADGEADNYCQVTSFDKSLGAAPALTPGEDAAPPPLPAPSLAAETESEGDETKLVVTASRTSPALLVFGEPSFEGGDSYNVDNDFAVSVKVKAFKALIDAYNTSEIIYFVGQRIDESSSPRPRDVSYQSSVAMCAEFTSRGFVQQKEVVIPHWPFEDVRLSIWRRG
jgi:hypothetical protein